MEHLKELLEHILRLLIGKFDAIDKKLDRLAGAKDITGGNRLLNITLRSLQRYKQYNILPHKKIRGKSYYWKSDVLSLLNKKK